MRFASIEALVDAVATRDPRGLGRAISLIENNSAKLPELMSKIAPSTGRSHVIGITGAPGVGKSTLTTALIDEFVAQGRTVGVLAIDPSSPFSGGALLGDRVRMQDHAVSPHIYIRSMASRGHLGGLASATTQALRIFDHAGFDLTIVETVGVGQAEIEIVSIADTIVVIQAPNFAGTLHMAKAGIVEIADIFVVNKKDHPGAQMLARDLNQLISQSEVSNEQRWCPVVVETVAVTNTGVDRLVTMIDKHRQCVSDQPSWARRRLDRASSEIRDIAVGQLTSQIMGRFKDSFIALTEAVAAGKLDPYQAANDLFEEMRRDV